MVKEKKKIIIGMPTSFGFYKVIIERLTQLGYQVIDISFQDHDFKYKNIWERLANLCRKTFLRDKAYKNQLKFRANGGHINEILDNIENEINFSLIIRPDIYPEWILKKISSKTSKMVGYQWDGIERYPAVKNLTKYFDKFYVFDEQDVCTSGRYLSLTNFYFSHLDRRNVSIKKCTFFFLGSFFPDRWNVIVDTSKLIRAIGGEPNFLLLGASNRDTLKNSLVGIKFIDTQISYHEYVNMVLESEVLVDFLVDRHTGLSFRIFESLGYRKKLLTNNPSIMKYDFYHPNNIFILGNETRTLKEFMDIPYCHLSFEIIKKYNFDNWIMKVLE